MPNFNSITLIGHLVADPEIRNVGDTQVCNFRIASTKRFGKGKESTTFIDCEAWRGQATAIAEHFQKGKPILVMGWLKQDNWEQDGQKRSKHVVSVDQFEFVGGMDVAVDAAQKSSGDDMDIPF